MSQDNRHRNIPYLFLFLCQLVFAQKAVMLSASLENLRPLVHMCTFSSYSMFSSHDRRHAIVMTSSITASLSTVLMGLLILTVHNFRSKIHCSVTSSTLHSTQKPRPSHLMEMHLLSYASKSRFDCNDMDAVTHGRSNRFCNNNLR